MTLRDQSLLSVLLIHKKLSFDDFLFFTSRCETGFEKLIYMIQLFFSLGSEFLTVRHALHCLKQRHCVLDDKVFLFDLVLLMLYIFVPFILYLRL